LWRPVGTEPIGGGGYAIELDIVRKISGINPILNYRNLCLTMRTPMRQEHHDLGSTVGFDANLVVVPVSADRGRRWHPDAKVLRCRGVKDG
jgi:hypothetical protein